MVQIGCQNGNLVKIMTPVCEGAGSHFALEVEVIGDICFVAQCISNIVEALHRSAFSNLATTGIWSYDTPLWWCIEIKSFALYLIN